MFARTAAAAIAALILVQMAAMATTAEPVSLMEIMRGLRADLIAVSDGLLTDDFDKVESAASAIADHPRIPPEQVRIVAAELQEQMAKFKQFDTLVHENAVAMAAAARAMDRDRAVEGYRRVFEACVGCHSAYRQRVSAALSAAAHRRQASATD